MWQIHYPSGPIELSGPPACRGDDVVFSTKSPVCQGDPKYALMTFHRIGYYMPHWNKRRDLLPRVTGPQGEYVWPEE